jgi:hypothetical protein
MHSPWELYEFLEFEDNNLSLEIRRFEGRGLDP